MYKQHNIGYNDTNGYNVIEFPQRIEYDKILPATYSYYYRASNLNISEIRRHSICHIQQVIEYSMYKGLGTTQMNQRKSL